MDISNDPDGAIDQPSDSKDKMLLSGSDSDDDTPLSTRFGAKQSPHREQNVSVKAEEKASMSISNTVSRKRKGSFSVTDPTPGDQAAMNLAGRPPLRLRCLVDRQLFNGVPFLTYEVSSKGRSRSVSICAADQCDKRWHTEPSNWRSKAIFQHVHQCHSDMEVQPKFEHAKTEKHNTKSENQSSLSQTAANTAAVVTEELPARASIDVELKGWL